MNRKFLAYIALAAVNAAGIVGRDPENNPAPIDTHTAKPARNNYRNNMIPNDHQQVVQMSRQHKNKYE